MVPWDVREGSGGCVWFATSLGPPRPQAFHRLPPPGDTALSMERWMFHQLALQEYILLCCQCPAGGLLDKPGK